MIWIYIISGIVMVWAWIQLLPVSALAYLEPEEWELATERWSGAKILDVRDANEYWEGSVPGAINISLGRLPVIWQKDLSPEDEVLIVARNWRQRKRAARILERRGFQRLYAVKDYDLPLKPERTLAGRKCSC